MVVPKKLTYSLVRSECLVCVSVGSSRGGTWLNWNLRFVGLEHVRSGVLDGVLLCVCKPGRRLARWFLYTFCVRLGKQALTCFPNRSISLRSSLRFSKRI